MDALAQVLPDPRPTTVVEWQAAAAGLLSPPCCAFHRNTEISARYAWLHAQAPDALKWAAMAAIASHHVRRALFPLRLGTDRSGRLDLTRRVARLRAITGDADTIRGANNAIFGDIFWVHLAYVADGPEALTRLLSGDPAYAGVLDAFTTIDRGRRVLADGSASPAERERAADEVWRGNLAVLDHEQRVVVQPHFDRLSAAFARLVSMGASTTFEVRGVRHEVRYFTSFYAWSLSRGLRRADRALGLPRITRLEDRWRWLEGSVVPQFRRVDADGALLAGSLDRVVAEAEHLMGTPCIDPG